VANNTKGNFFADMKLPVKIGMGFGTMALLLVSSDFDHHLSSQPDEKAD